MGVGLYESFILWIVDCIDALDVEAVLPRLQSALTSESKALSNEVVVCMMRLHYLRTDLVVHHQQNRDLIALIDIWVSI